MRKTLGSATFKIFAPTLIASRDKETGAMRIEGVASSTVRDHHGDQLTAKALRKMEQSALGMTIFMNHEYRLTDVFGTVETARLVKAGQDPKTGEDVYDLRMGIVVAKSNEEARKAFDLIEQDKVKLGLSIGAMVPEGAAVFDKSAGGRYLIDDVDLIETSVVSIPANPRSFIDYAVKAFAGVYPDKVDRKSLLEEWAELEDAEPIEKAAEKTCPDCGHSAGCGCGCKNDMHDAAIPLMAGLGDVVELTVNEDGTASSEIVAKAGTPEAEEFAATFGDPEHPVDLVPVINDEDADLEKTRVTVWDGDRTIEVDTGRAKPKSDENLPAQADPENAAVASTSAGEVQKALERDEEVSPEVMIAASRTLDNSNALVKALHGQLMAARGQIRDLTEERDQAITLARQTMENTSALLVRLGDLPVGRKTGFVEVQKSFADLEGIYDDEMRKHFKKG